MEVFADIELAACIDATTRAAQQVGAAVGTCKSQLLATLEKGCDAVILRTDHLPALNAALAAAAGALAERLLADLPPEVVVGLSDFSVETSVYASGGVGIRLTATGPTGERRVVANVH